MNLDRFKLIAVQLIATGGGYHLAMSVREERRLAEKAGNPDAVAYADAKLQIIGEIEDKRASI